MGQLAARERARLSRRAAACALARWVLGVRQRAGQRRRMGMAAGAGRLRALGANAPELRSLAVHGLSLPDAELDAFARGCARLRRVHFVRCELSARGFRLFLREARSLLGRGAGEVGAHHPLRNRVIVHEGIHALLFCLHPRGSSAGASATCPFLCAP